MTRAVKTIALFVMMTVAGSAVQAQLLTVPVQTTERSGGCHEHGGKIPSRAPSNYQCCLAGHNVGVPQSAHRTQPIAIAHSDLVAEAPTPVLTAVNSSKISAPAVGPPGGIPLRI